MEDPRLDLRTWLVTGRPPRPTDDRHAEAIVTAAAQQALTGLLADVIAPSPAWPTALRTHATQAARELLLRSVRQLDLAARVMALLSQQGQRTLPLKGAALAEWLYDSPAHRPMSDVDVLALDSPTACLDVLVQQGFRRVAAADHAWALSDPLTGGTVELHAAPTSCPGLLPFDRDGLWARRQSRGPQVHEVPAPEDLLVLLALHASFQHGLVLTLVQWLDFRRLWERQPITLDRLAEIVRDRAVARAVALALHTADRLVTLPLTADARPWIGQRLPHALRAWMDNRPLLAFVAPAAPALGRLRWHIAAGRRLRLIHGTLLAKPPGERRTPLQRTGDLLTRLWRLGLRRSRP